MALINTSTPSNTSISSVFARIDARSGVLTPGLPVLPAGVERYPIAGGGSHSLYVMAGDEITIVDREGLQPVDIIFFSPDGRSDAAMLGLKGGRDASDIHQTMASDASGKKVLTALAKSGFDITRADVIRLFAEGSRAGEASIFHAASDGLLITCVVGGAMKPDTQNTLTEIALYIQRVQSDTNTNGNTDKRLPPSPLADPLQDYNINPGMAKAYTVKAGEYIQILDVQGRECSDFQALSLRALDKGLERRIDSATTRSLMGMLYPKPGIFSKYFSSDQEALIEIVQDTCGQHDTFNLACTARYYEDMGYPGHVNCTDNMNKDLAQFGIKPRGGWSSINFFFNTMLDDNHTLGMDDPWSRPGDYVLLRALTDLVCVSTACPCDIDSANGWNPTDIQVRVYEKDEDFKRTIAWRKTAEDDMQETKQTGFHDGFAKHTRDFTEYNGYWLANAMSNYGAVAEYWACREKVAVMDLSPLRKYEIIGPDATELMQWCVTRDVKKLSDGQVVYTAMCYEHGGMIDDGTIYRLGETNYRWVGGNDTSGLWLREQAEKKGYNVWVRNSTDQLCNIAVQGPHSQDLLKNILWTPPQRSTVEELPWFRFTVARLGDFHGAICVLSRTGYSGELGYELFCHPKDAQLFFDAVWEAGQAYGIAPLGLAALDMLRIEAGLVFAGYEFCDQTNPFEAGIGFTVALKTTDDFIGRSVLEERKAHPQRQLVGLDIQSGIVPANGDCIRVGRAQVGEITSATKSPILGKTIALARLDVAHAQIGSGVEVGQLDGQQKRLSATITAFPHFDPKKERVRGNYPAPL